MSELLESMAKGQRDRQALIRRFGFVPHSILRISRGGLSKSLFHLSNERAQKMKGVKSEGRIDRSKSVKAREKQQLLQSNGILGGVLEMVPKDREMASVMAAELVDFFVKYYAVPGAVYLDPFSAQGVQVQVALMRGLSYYGGDASAAYVAYTNAVLRRLDIPEGLHVEVRAGDSRDPSWIPDGVGDFSFYSPPYWDVEYYGPEPEQLGTGHTYPEFLQGMEDVARAWHPKFKPGAWIVVNVNDLRRDGEFIPYHVDVVALMRRAGFRLHDIWVIEGLIAGLPKAFAVSFNLRRIAPKLHEYALVFRA